MSISKYFALAGLILGAILTAGAGMLMVSQSTREQTPIAELTPAAHDMARDIKVMAKDPALDRMPATKAFILEKTEEFTADPAPRPETCDQDGAEGLKFGSFCVTAASQTVMLRGGQFAWLSELQGHENLRVVLSQHVKTGDLTLLTGLPQLTTLNLFGAQIEALIASVFVDDGLPKRLGSVVRGVGVGLAGPDRLHGCFAGVLGRGEIGLPEPEVDRVTACGLEDLPDATDRH